jgi:Raf kinase inhibitor-like YbhB/YbcL family protein
MKLKLTSPAFGENAVIPKKYTGEGDDVSPPLQWDAPPEKTQSFVLICDDPDAPKKTWVHWVLFNVPKDARSLSEAFPKVKEHSTGARQGKNDFPSDNIGYGGPMPPPGHGVHHYHFKLYALDTTLNLAPGATKQQVEAAMKGHVLAEGELIGTYQR